MVKAPTWNDSKFIDPEDLEEASLEAELIATENGKQIEETVALFFERGMFCGVNKDGLVGLINVNCSSEDVYNILMTCLRTNIHAYEEYHKGLN